MYKIYPKMYQFGGRLCPLDRTLRIYIDLVNVEISAPTVNQYFLQTLKVFRTGQQFLILILSLISDALEKEERLIKSHYPRQIIRLLRHMMGIDCI